MSEPLTVLHVFGRMDRGGAETRTIEVMRQIDPARFRLVFCSLSGLPGAYDGEIRGLGGEVFYCRLGRRFPWRFVRLLERQHVDVVHSHVLLSSGLILTLSRFAGVRVRIANFRSEQDGHPNTGGRRLYRFMMRRLINWNATDIIAVTEATMSAIWGKRYRTDARCQIIPNGIRTEGLTELAVGPPAREYLHAPEGRLVLHVGRSLPEKNRMRAIGIVSALRERVPQTKLAFVGRMDAKEQEDLSQSAKKLGSDFAVCYLGERVDVGELLAGADLLLLPSRREGLPGVLLEACAVGTPVLASDLPGIREAAKTLSLVHCQDLGDSDETWAVSAAAILERPLDAQGRLASVHDFAAGPYTIDRAVENLCRLWSQQVRVERGDA